MGKAKRKPRPSQPNWVWFDNDNCWWCKNRNNCNQCKWLKQNHKIPVKNKSATYREDVGDFGND